MNNFLILILFKKIILLKLGRKSIGAHIGYKIWVKEAKRNQTGGMLVRFDVRVFLVNDFTNLPSVLL